MLRPVFSGLINSTDIASHVYNTRRLFAASSQRGVQPVRSVLTSQVYVPEYSYYGGTELYGGFAYWVQAQTLPTKLKHRPPPHQSFPCLTCE